MNGSERVESSNHSRDYRQARELGIGALGLQAAAASLVFWAGQQASACNRFIIKRGGLMGVLLVPGVTTS